MRPDAAAVLWDARQAGRRIHEFIEGRTYEEYRQDALVRSAVERQFEILGEALNRLSRIDSEVSAAIPELSRMVAFRNILIHGYATVDDSIVWDVATTRLDAVIALFDELLRQEGSGRAL